jgi:hypothetical protein
MAPYLAANRGCGAYGVNRGRVSMAGKFSKVGSGPDKSALKTIITGPSGVGKTWFVSTIANDDGRGIFFLPVEEGAKGICPDAKPEGFRDEHDRWVIPANIGELHMALDSFAREQNAPDPQTGKRPFRHLGIDSLSAVERLIHEAALGVEKARHLEDREFGKVWEACMPFWNNFISTLDAIRRTGVNIWLIAHSANLYTSSELTGDVYERWDLAFRGGKKGSAVRETVRQWSDQVLFLQKTISVQKGTKEKRSMAKLGGRVLVTQDTGAIYAKTRLPMPATIPATWPDLVRAMRSGAPVNVDRTREQIAGISARLSAEDRESIQRDVAKAANAVQLAAVLSRAQGMLAVSADPDDDAEDDGNTPSGYANGAAPASDEAKLRAIDEGRA